MFELAIRRPVIATVALAVVCVFGVLAVLRVPVQMIPDLDPRVVTVTTRWPGATPQDVEKEIVIEQEEYLRTVPGLERMVSRARTGDAEIELEFPWGTDLNEALLRVNNALSQVPGYPENVDQPRIGTSSFSDNAFMYFRIQPLPGNPRRLQMPMMYDFIDTHVRSRLERVPGVAQIDLWGGAERQIRIRIDPEALALRGITIAQLRDAIRARNRDVSGGDLESGKRRYLLRTVGRFRDLDDIRQLIVARHGGTLVRLADVAEVELGHFEERMVSFANGRPNITLGVRRQVGANVVQVMDRVMAAVAELNAGLLPDAGLRMELTSEDVRYVQNAVAVVFKNLAIGALLAVMVLYAFLRTPAATLIGALGVPICTLAAFLGLELTGRTINVISLAGVAFAIGMTLDNSIVVLETIHRRLGAGATRVAAALEGVREVWPAVLASTLTTVFVFLPVVFVNEEAGQLYSGIAIAIAASILMSMVVAVTWVLAASARWLSAGRPPGGAASGGFARMVLAFTGWTIARPWRRLAVVGSVLAASVAAVMQLTPPAEYLPEGEEQKTFSFMFAPPGYSLTEMRRTLDRVHAQFLPHLDDDPDAFREGRSPVPPLRFVVSYARPQMLLMIAETKNRDEIDPLIDVIGRHFAEYPGMISFSSRGSIFASNLGGTRSINLDISGPELAPLFATAARAFELANQVFDHPQVRPQPPSLTMAQPLLEVRPDWVRAAEMGLGADDLGYAVAALTDGAYVDEFFLGDDKIDMFLFGRAGSAVRPEALPHLTVYTPRAGMVPLSALATVTLRANTETIRRVDGQRTITLSIIPPRSVPLEAGVERVRQRIIAPLRADPAVPPSVHLAITGASDRLAATRQSLGGNFVVAVLIAYLLMVAIFSHWGWPLVILTSVPVGVAGGIVGLWLLNLAGASMPLVGLAAFRQPFDMITMLGFLVLIGTVVNNPILLVEHAVRAVRERNVAVQQAILEATRTRLRPILMSTITTVFGLSPLVLLPGEGTELYRGLGAIVLFGLLFSALVTLSFMPAVLATVLGATRRAPAAARAGAAPT